MPSHPFFEGSSNLRASPVCGNHQGVANELECTRLQLRADESVYRIHRTRDREGRIFLVEDVTLPAALFPGLADKEVIPDHIGPLAQEYGILLGRAEERISMGIPPGAIADAIANALQVATGAPMIVIDRVVLMRDCQRPVEWRLAHCHPAGADFS